MGEAEAGAAGQLIFHVLNTRILRYWRSGTGGGDGGGSCEGRVGGEGAVGATASSQPPQAVARKGSGLAAQVLSLALLVQKYKY